MKIVTLITPARINKPNRVYLEGIVESILELGNAIRTNGNGSVYNPANVSHPYVVHYAPSSTYYEDLTNKAPEANDKQRLAAHQKAMEIFPHLSHWSDGDQAEIYRCVWAIYGQNLDRPADNIFIFPSTSKIPHQSDERLYYKAIRLAKASGIPIRELKPKR